MTDEECGSLPVFSDGQYCISCWGMTWRERLLGLLKGEIWLWVWSGSTQPPVALDVSAPLFKSEERETK